MTKVFISYSHDSDEHRDFVRGIADRLRKDGVDCLIDRYINGFPPEGWQRWMENQIEAADFVLLVCTETYLRRYRGQETEGGKGVNFEGVVISQILYDHYYKNTKFIPTIPDAGSFNHVPLPLKPYSTYHLNHQYNDVYRILTGQAEYEQPELGEVRQLPTVNTHSPRRIYSDDLPTVEGELFGRTDELALLDQALNDDGIHIVQFVASGGTGKTKLIRTWLDENDDKIDGLIAWSFYSQGSGEDKQISATPFFMQALKSLDSDKSISDFHTEEEKGEYIADLLREKRCLLVLDGLEPLQQVGRGMRGELKDRAIRKMLRCLVGGHSSLCIITTRLPVHELKGRRQVMQHDLQNLAPEDGVALLWSFGVSGRDVDMLAAVEEYGRHALALHLLGNALATYLDGDVRKRDTLTELIGDYDDVERHAFKVMQAYQHWLAGTPELKLLYLLGLFDHPVEQEVLEVLWEAEIPGLTEGVERKAWLVAQRNLTQKYQMMSKHEGQGDLFDCHPLIREYFGRQLKDSQDEVWRQAHTVLYEYYKGLGKHLPDTLEEMQPLFRAVAHGCSARFEQDAFKLYRERILRLPIYFVTDVLGAFNDDLSVITNFYSAPWSKITDTFTKKDKFLIHNLVGFRLKALGRFHDAQIPYTQASRITYANKYCSEASVNLSNISNLYLTHGDLGNATRSAEKSVEYADRSGKLTHRIHKRCNLAYCLFISGSKEAGIFYEEAEDIATKAQRDDIMLNAIANYRYCEYLISKKAFDKVHEKVNDSLSCHGKLQKYHQLFFAVNFLARGLANLYCDSHPTSDAQQDLTSAIVRLNQSGQQSFIPFGYLAYAKLAQNDKCFDQSFQSLAEAYEIAEPSGMRLHLTDYHLEMARLILAVEADPTQYPEATPDRKQRTLPFADQEEPGILTLKGHIAEAARLIQETGYHRRDAELAELQKALERP